MDAEQTNLVIDSLIRAKRSIIGVISNDEYRVMRGLDEVCHMDKQRHPKTGRPKKLYAWDIFDGFKTWRDGDKLPDTLITRQGKREMPIINPVAAIRAIINFPQSEESKAHGRVKTEGIFVMKGLEILMQSDPTIVRGLRNLNMDFKPLEHSLLLLSPVLQLPPGLDSEVSIIDYPLPGDEEIEKTLDAVLSGDEVTNKLNSDSGDRHALVNALKGLEMDDIMVTLNRGLVRFKGEIRPETIDLVLDEKRQIVRKSGVLEYVRTDETMDTMGGLGNLKTYWAEVELAFTDKARERHVDVPRGVLLGGIPGTGKSLAAKVFAGGRHPWPLLRMSMSELMAQSGGVVGQSQAGLHQGLKVVEAVSPCLLWIDEIEKSLARKSGEMDGGTRSDMMADLLTWMQESTAPVFIVATANDAQALPVELVRRFDETFFLDLPGPAARREIFAIHLAKRGQNLADFDAELLVKESRNYTGAEIEKAIARAIRKALVREFAGEPFKVATDDVLKALAEIRPISSTMADQLDYYREWDARPADSDDEESTNAANAATKKQVRW